MPKSRSTPTPKPFLASLGFSGGNGKPAPDKDAERLAHVEQLVARLQTMLDTQFQRIVDMQVVIDRLTAERNR